MRENIIEIFSSIQGEGPYVGYRQVFIRLADCNLQCRYCDTDHAAEAHPFCRIQKSADEMAFRQVENPLAAPAAAGYITELLRQAPHQAVSITGGEPLLHPMFINALAPLLAAPILLETNGTLPRELAAVLPAVDIISMDIKLPQMAGWSLWAVHREFLRIAREKEVYVKIVVARDASREELQEAFQLIREVDGRIPLILQPASPCGDIAAPRPEMMLAVQHQALRELENVRVIPQTHVLLGNL